MVVDHYALAGSWESRARGSAQRVMVIDDLASEYHDCDIILNQNLLTSSTSQYEGKVPVNCRRITGPAYALLRPEFAQLRSSCRRASSDKVRVLLFMGTGDPDGVTLRVAALLQQMSKPDLQVDVVVGSSNPRGDEIRLLCEQSANFRFHRQTPNMAELMARADLAVTAGGTSSWERCCLGLPAVVLAIADNQIEASTELADRGACIFLGRSGEVTDQHLSECIEALATNPARRRAMSDAGFGLVDGRGCERVVAEMGVL